MARKPPGSAPRRRFKPLQTAELGELVRALESRREDAAAGPVNYGLIDHLVEELEAEQERRVRALRGLRVPRSREVPEP